MTRNAIALCVALATAACASGPAFQEAPPPAAGKGLVYFLRPMVAGGSFWNTRFSVNGAEVVSLSNGGYSWVSLDAGTYEVSSQYLGTAPFEIRIAVPAGSTHYVEMRQAETVNYGTGARQDRLIEIPRETAHPMLEKMKYTQAVR
jgi:hypothetical protein